MNANGRIIIRRGDGDEFVYQWEGGSVIGVMREFLDENANIAHLAGDTLTIGPFRLRIIEADDDAAVIYAERIETA